MTERCRACETPFERRGGKIYCDACGKGAARSAIHNAIQRGHLQRQPCEICGMPQTQAHHEDYARQLEVRWLCPTHHARADTARRKRLRTTESEARRP